MIFEHVKMKKILLEWNIHTRNNGEMSESVSTDEHVMELMLKILNPWQTGIH